MTTALFLAGDIPLSLMLFSAPELLRFRWFVPLPTGGAGVVGTGLTTFALWSVISLVVVVPIDRLQPPRQPTALPAWAES